MHKRHGLHLSADLPIVIEVADQGATLQVVLPRLDEMITEGMVTLKKVEVLVYRAE